MTGPTSIALSWQPGTGTATGFELQTAPVSSGPWSTIASTSPSVTGFMHTGLTTGVPYLYQVRAIGTGGTSAFTTPVSATPFAIGPVAPPVPTGLTATVSSSSALLVSWTVASPVAVELQRSTSAGGPFGLIFTSPAGTTQYQETGLTASTAYWYRVRATDSAGQSDYSNAVSATTQAPATPAAPTNLVAVQEVLNSQSAVRLTWTDAAGNESGYEVQSSTDGYNWTVISNLPADSTIFVHTTPAFGRNDYRVRAVNAGGASAWASTTIQAGVITVGYICPEPTLASASATSDTALAVTWTYSSLGNCGTVAVERALSSTGPFLEVGRSSYFFAYPPPPLSSGLFNDTNRAPGTTYYYRLRSIGSGTNWGSSSYTLTFSGTTTNTLPAPTGLTATVTSSSTARLNWVDPASNETGFAVEYATAAGGSFTTAFTLPAGSVQAYVDGMSANTPYWVRVVTLKGTARSAPSNVAAFTTAKTAALTATADTTVIESTANAAFQTRTEATGPNSVGCYFSWTTDLYANVYLMHNCFMSALRFDTSSLAGKTTLSAKLVLKPCVLAPWLDDSATYAVFAMAGAWNPTTVTYNTLPPRHSTGGWSIPAPTTFAPSVFDVTTIVGKWTSGAWTNNGLLVQQYPATDRLPKLNGVVMNAQNQGTEYCSLEQNGGVAGNRPLLLVDYQ